MIPGIPVPDDAGIQTPVEVKLKPKWRYDSSRRSFVSDGGEKFSPASVLPKGTKIVYKAPLLAEADESKLSKDEKDLLRYMQVILPKGEKPSAYVAEIRSWDFVEDASSGPEISLPMQEP